MSKRQDRSKTVRSRVEQEQARVRYLVKVGFILGISVGFFSCGGAVYVALHLLRKL